MSMKRSRTLMFASGILVVGIAAYSCSRLAPASTDLTGDRRVDVVARDTATGTLRIYPGDGAGHFGAFEGGTT